MSGDNYNHTIIPRKPKILGQKNEGLGVFPSEGSVLRLLALLAVDTDLGIPFEHFSASVSVYADALSFIPKLSSTFITVSNLGFAPA